MSQSETNNIFDRIEMSPNLRGSLQRAITYAYEQSHREVTLEHLLLALADDREAAVILEASAVNVQALLTDVSSYLGRLEDRVTEAGRHQPGLGSDVRHIIQSAGAAAQKSQRRAVTSALVLAAVVGEGRSPSAQILRTHGLTFDNAITALKQANAAASTRPLPQEPVAPAGDTSLAQQPASPVRLDPPAGAPAPTLAAPPQPTAAAGSTARLQNMQAAHDIIAGARERIAAARGAIAARSGESEPGVPGEPLPDPVLRYADGEPIAEIGTLAANEDAQVQPSSAAHSRERQPPGPAPQDEAYTDAAAAGAEPVEPDAARPRDSHAAAPTPAPAAPATGKFAVPTEATPPAAMTAPPPADERADVASGASAPAPPAGDPVAAPFDGPPPQLAPPPKLPPPPVFESANRAPGGPSPSPAAPPGPGDLPPPPTAPAGAEAAAPTHPPSRPLPALTVPPPHGQTPPVGETQPTLERSPSPPAQVSPADAPPPPASLPHAPGPAPAPAPSPPQAPPIRSAQAPSPDAAQPAWRQPPPAAQPPPGPLTNPGQPPHQDGPAVRPPIPAPQPTPPVTAMPPAGAQGTAPPQFEPSPRAMAPPTFAPSRGIPPQQMPFDAEPLEPEQLIRDIPSRMRVGVPMTVEIRAPRAQLEAWSGGNSDPRARDDQIITKAMVMRLKAPEGGFTVETASPETQWSEGYMGPLSDEIVSWRWIVTPLESGRMPLQLSVSTRVVARDGLAAARVLPEQNVAVRVSPNYASWGRRVAIGLAFAMAGLLIGYFADGLFSVGSTILVRQ